MARAQTGSQNRMGGANTVFHAEKLSEIDTTIQKAIREDKLPGCVLWLQHQETSYHRAYGHRSMEPREETMTEDTIFDAASLTKVVATTPAIMLLVERGKLKLDSPARAYLDEFNGHGKEAITLRQLLSHTSGLPPSLNRLAAWSGYRTAIQMACAETPIAPPGEAFRYSDINFIILGEIVQRVGGSRLNEFVRRELYTPLKMKDTGFLPDPGLLKRIAPTEVVDERILRGKVHDPTAQRMDGVAGHAGLFTTAADLARFARMLLNAGELDGMRILTPETIQLMTSVQTPAQIPARRGLGWDIDSPFSSPRGQLFPIGSYGQTGWTGTSIWIDPFSRTFIIVLSNRNHPTEAGNVTALRARLGTLAAEAVAGFDFANVPGALPRKTSGKKNKVDP